MVEHSNPKVKKFMTGVHLVDGSMQCHSLQALFVALDAPESEMRRREEVLYHFFIHRVFLNGNAGGTTTHYSNWLAEKSDSQLINHHSN